MLDKELGKLWADTNYMETGYSSLVACLIRKLVDERKNLLLMRHAGGARWTDKEEAAAEKLALAISVLTPKLGNDITPALSPANRSPASAHKHPPLLELAILLSQPTALGRSSFAQI